MQVSKWREGEEEQLAAQAKQAAAVQLEEYRQRERDEEREGRKQERTKAKLREYRKEKEQKEAEQEAWLEGLKAETEKLRKERAVEGEGRVKYRKELLTNKLHRQQQYLEELAEQERAKERQLAALRQQVPHSVM